jgi:hypothetical protein
MWHNNHYHMKIFKKIIRTVRIADMSQDSSGLPTECKAAMETITLQSSV